MRRGRRDHRRRPLSRSGCSTRRATSTTRCAIRSSWRRSPSISPRSDPRIRRPSTQMIERAKPVSTRRGPTAPARTRAAGLSSSAKPAAARSTTIDIRRCATMGCRWCAPSMEGIFAAQKLDAIVYPTASAGPPLGAPAARAPGGGAAVADQHRQPDRVSGSDRAGGLHRRRPAGRDSRSSARRSASPGSSRSATASSRRRARGDSPVHTPRLAGEAVPFRRSSAGHECGHGGAEAQRLCVSEPRCLCATSVNRLPLCSLRLCASAPPWPHS